MKIKVEGSGMSVILYVEYRPWTPADAPWTASPAGIIGAAKGHWTRDASLGGGYSILFYGTGLGDQILLFESVTINAHGPGAGCIYLPAARCSRTASSNGRFYRCNPAAESPAGFIKK